jgi:thioredoxin 1
MKIIKFEKDNCPSCVVVSNILNVRGVEYEPINIMDCDPELGVKYEIMSVPVTILLDGEGNEVKRVIGANVGQLQELIQLSEGK